MEKADILSCYGTCLFRIAFGLIGNIIHFLTICFLPCGVKPQESLLKAFHFKVDIIVV